MKFNQKKAVAFINKMIRANHSKTADLRAPKSPLIDEHGYQIIGNNKFFVRFYDPPYNLEQEQHKRIYEPAYNLEQEQHKRIYRSICSTIMSRSDCFNTELAPPDIDTLKLMIKEHRLRRQIKYHFINNNDYPCVNARYLLYIMTVFPDARFYYNQTDRYPMVCVRSEFGDAILTSLKL